MFNHLEKFDTEVHTVEKTQDTQNLVIHNDEVNTFDWVIEALVQVCKHDYHQAEQCSILIHSKGKYAVKEGSYDSLKPMKDAIAERGINATIE